MIKAVIFDMDGLMIDSERVTFEGYQHVLAKENLTMSEEKYKTLLGKPVKAVHDLFKEDYGPQYDVDQIIKDVHAYIAKRFETEGVPLKPGLVELLKYLKENNYKTIIATSSHRNRVDLIVKQAQIDQYFDDSICGDEVTKGKPNPEVFLKACQKLQVSPQDALVLEDSESGINAAYNAEIKVIGIPDMKYPEEKYVKMTYKIMDNLFQVKDFLEENNK
ncbi:HAD family phosphatase [Erysipelatoclostridium sp. An173]|uniref:HAD family phosphatase n=1 Tax=Candidatus Erysipelatoclostridium merdavium TaxID=2838566 RepID=A0A9D1XLS2_9FIRM|nr:HAD family phosphatase [Erysipelatoclostridium sp. An173]OUP77195.1 hydrolase [Erysipelatoclostridium sp. An173]HIX81411.1 HAD family phosphatase [Candidatus Erysipelatoclostridium merdavium]